jgi:hypothetical protein
MLDEQELPAQLYTDGGAESTPISLDAYLNKTGLITIHLGEEAWVQVSPLVARRFTERIRQAVGESLTEMLMPVEPSGRDG